MRRIPCFCVRRSNPTAAFNDGLSVWRTCSILHRGMRKKSRRLPRIAFEFAAAIGGVNRSHPAE